jgi:DMSO/TMAO reductase YedYZ molybdopterin-dependent catalytic subunit
MKDSSSAGASRPASRYRPAVGSVIMEPSGLVLVPAPSSALDTFLTPVAYHTVVARHGIAHTDGKDWTLTVDGLVEHPLRVDLGELRARPAREVTAVLECAGDPERPDRPTRPVSNAVWRGVPLASLLEAEWRPGRPTCGCRARTGALMPEPRTTAT